MKALNRTALATILKAKRDDKNMGLRELATITGISAATLSRVESGQDMDVNTLIRILDWIDLPLKCFIKEV